MTAPNPQLAAMHRDLGDLVEQLSAQQEAATDPDRIEAIGNLIRETNFRITNVERALFAAQTAAIGDAVDELMRSKAEVDRAIARIDQLNQAIATVTQFLGLVDKVLRLVP
jgi:2C-methyl-D-erythritol 2,4-cyclodiphosphate synthase